MPDMLYCRRSPFHASADCRLPCCRRFSIFRYFDGCVAAALPYATSYADDAQPFHYDIAGYFAFDAKECRAKRDVRPRMYAAIITIDVTFSLRHYCLRYNIFSRRFID